MSDRSSAYIFGRVFELIDKHVPKGKRFTQARRFWTMSLEFDFGPSDMHADPALKRLGLARKGLSPDYPEEGPITIYLGEVGWRGALPTGSAEPK